MRFRKQAGNVVLGLAMLVAITGSAFAKNSGRLNLRQDVTVNGVQLSAGQYKVSWKTHSPEATVTFKHEKGSVASTEGKLEERPTRYDNDAVVFASNQDGSRSILEIRFAGSNKVLTFGESSPSSETIVPKSDTASLASAQATKVSGSSPATRSMTHRDFRQQGFTIDPNLLQLLFRAQQSTPTTTERRPMVN
jgi:hypothetical protein